MGQHAAPPLVPPTVKHLPWLDVLRGLAVLMVIGLHYLGEVYPQDKLPWDGWWRDWRGPLGAGFLAFLPLSYGGAGVTLFFVLSGYVIHRSYTLSADRSWRQFAARRFWRLYPAYLVAVALLVLLSVRYGRPPTGWNLASHLLLVHNTDPRPGVYFGLNPSFWSLAVEAQLYVLYPLALLLLRRVGPAGLLAVGCAASGVWRAAGYATDSWATDPTDAVWFSPVALWPDWLLGMVLADRHLSGGRVFLRPWLVMGGAAVLWAASDMWRPTAVLARSVPAVGFAALVEWGLARAGRPVRGTRWLVGLGVVSYSVYLIHQPLVPRFLDRLRPMLPADRPDLLMVIGLPLFVAAVSALATGLYFLAERPGVWLGRRLGSARRGPNGRV